MQAARRHVPGQRPCQQRRTHSQRTEDRAGLNGAHHCEGEWSKTVNAEGDGREEDGAQDSNKVAPGRDSAHRTQVVYELPLNGP